jgi:hypothetical protein
VLAAIRAEVHVIDAASFAQRSLTITSEGLEDDGQPIIAERGWIRRLAPLSWMSSLDASTLVGAQRAAGLSALAAILHDERISWLTPVGLLGPAENKPFQYRHAQSVHVPVPEWVVTTDPRRAPEDNGWVTKPLGPGSFIDEGGIEQTVPTTPFDPATRSALAGAPFILQRRVFARTHARVVTVGDWSPEERQLYIAEARRDMDQQQADKRDVRVRAQQVFTTTLVLGAAIGASYSRTRHGSAGTAVYLLAGGLTALAGFAAAGVITAKSLIGAPSLVNLINAPAGEFEERLVNEYAATRYVGAATVAVLVTVMRDSVLVLILAFITFACAYLWG